MHKAHSMLAYSPQTDTAESVSYRIGYLEGQIAVYKRMVTTLQTEIDSKALTLELTKGLLGVAETELRDLRQKLDAIHASARAASPILTFARPVSPTRAISPVRAEPASLRAASPEPIRPELGVTYNTSSPRYSPVLVLTEAARSPTPVPAPRSGARTPITESDEDLPTTPPPAKSTARATPTEPKFKIPDPPADATEAHKKAHELTYAFGKRYHLTRSNDLKPLKAISKAAVDMYKSLDLKRKSTTFRDESKHLIKAQEQSYELDEACKLKSTAESTLLKEALALYLRENDKILIQDGPRAAKAAGGKPPRPSAPTAAEQSAAATGAGAAEAEAARAEAAEAARAEAARAEAARAEAAEEARVEAARAERLRSIQAQLDTLMVEYQPLKDKLKILQANKKKTAEAAEAMMFQKQMKPLLPRYNELKAHKERLEAELNENA